MNYRRVSIIVLKGLSVTLGIQSTNNAPITLGITHITEHDKFVLKGHKPANDKNIISLCYISRSHQGGNNSNNCTSGYILDKNEFQSIKGIND